MARYSKGLQGVIAGESKVGYVNGLQGVLRYRGYSIEDLAKNTSYIETAYLLLNGKLPKQSELTDFQEKLKIRRALPSGFNDIIRALPKDAHPMATLQTAVAALGTFKDKTLDQSTPKEVMETALELVAQFPTIVATCWRASQGKDILEPKNDLDHASNFLYMCTGEIPEADGTKLFDTCLTLHAEHSFNASTFTTRVVTSSLPSFYAAISAGVGSLYGPLHGGANERVLSMISEIKGPDEAEAWVMKKLANKEKIMGMGHRIYQVKDPRSFVLEEMLAQYAKKKNQTQDYEVLKIIEKVMQREMEKKGKDIWPNVDFFSGAVYKILGIPAKLFTPIFAVARIAGWCAHVIEQLEDNRIYRPICEYIGDTDLKVTPIEKR